MARSSRSPLAVAVGEERDRAGAEVFSEAQRLLYSPAVAAAAEAAGEAAGGIDFEAGGEHGVDAQLPAERGRRRARGRRRRSPSRGGQSVSVPRIFVSSEPSGSSTRWDPM